MAPGPAGGGRGGNEREPLWTLTGPAGVEIKLLRSLVGGCHRGNSTHRVWSVGRRALNVADVARAGQAPL